MQFTRHHVTSWGVHTNRYILKFHKNTFTVTKIVTYYWVHLAISTPYSSVHTHTHTHPHTHTHTPTHTHTHAPTPTHTHTDIPILSGVSRDPTIWIVDDEVLITAHLTGSNPPFTSYRLLKDSQLVTSSRIQVTYRNSSGNFTFRIPQVMVSDEGRYTLEVINPIGVGHINFTIIVYCKL